MEPHFQTCADHLRQHDYGRYIACLYLGEELRQAAFAIYAFNSKVDQIADLISEPMPGEIRIQWWLDIVKNATTRSGDPIARALQETITQYDLPIDKFDSLLNARIFDLYHDPMSDRIALETYLGETRSSLLHLLIMVGEKLAGDAQDVAVSNHIADACGHGGVFLGTVELLKALPLHEHNKRNYFPVELSSRERRADITESQNSNIVDTDWLGDISGYALDHYSAAMVAIRQLPVHRRALFSQLPLAKQELERLQQRGIDLRANYQPLSRLAINWRLWKAARALAKNTVSE